MQAISRTKGYYRGPDRRSGDDSGEEMDRDDCRERARSCFADAIAARDPEERERLWQRGEQWLTRWRHWAPRGFKAKA